MFEIKARYDILAAIYEHLVTTANYDAAKMFAKEAALPEHELALVAVRQDVKNHIKVGRIEAALKELRQHFPAILQDQSSLLFELMLMQLIELIRASDFDTNPASIDPALEYARAQVLPLIKDGQKDSPERMVELQKVMSLICIDASKGLPIVLADLLDQKSRDELATKVDSTILKSQNRMDLSSLERLRMLRDIMHKSIGSSTGDFRVEGIDFVEL